MAGKGGTKLAYFLAGLGLGGAVAFLVSGPAAEESSPALPVNPGLKGGPMQEEIGAVAGDIWNTLNARGELTIAQLKKEVKAKPPIMDWAIGWLAREGKVRIKQEKRTLRIRLQ